MQKRIKRMNILLGECMVFCAMTKHFAFIFDFMHNIYQKQSYCLLNETLFNTSTMTAGSTQHRFTDLHRLSAEQIIFFMSLVKDPFITVKFSQ